MEAQQRALLQRELEHVMPGDVMSVRETGRGPAYRMCVWWRRDGNVSFCGALEDSGVFKTISWWWARRVNRLVWIWWEMRKARRA